MPRNKPRPRAADRIVDDDGAVVGTIADFVRGSAYAVLEIANDEELLNRLLANDKMCQRLFGAIEAAEEYVIGTRA